MMGYDEAATINGKKTRLKADRQDQIGRNIVYRGTESTAIGFAARSDPLQIFPFRTQHPTAELIIITFYMCPLSDRNSGLIAPNL